MNAPVDAAGRRPDDGRSPASVHVWLIVCCLGVFLAQRVVGPRMIETFAVHGPSVAAGEVYRLLTGGFLHLGVAHLGMNMLALFFLGRIIEPVLARSGSLRFTALYVLSLLCGSLGALALDFDTAAIGASGAVYGLMGAAVTVPMRMGLGWNRLGVAPWIVFNLLITFSIPGISVGGHIGGLLGGLVLGWVLTPRAR